MWIPPRPSHSLDFGRVARLVSWALCLLLAGPVALLAQEQEQVAGQEAVERLEETLDELEERLEEIDDLEEEASEFGSREALRRQRRELRRAREEVRQHVRGAVRSGRSDAKVSFFSAIHLDKDDVGNDLVAIGGSVFAAGDVEGDVVAVLGSAHIDGRVTGDVVAVGGKVVLGPEAEVMGSVTAVGGQIEEAEGAVIHGDTNEIAVGEGLSLDPFDWDFDFDRGSWFRWRNFMELTWGLSGLLMLLLLCSLVVLIGGERVEKIRRMATSSPFRSGLVGLAIQLFFLPVLLVVVIILYISLVGIPLLLLIPFVVLALIVAMLVGFTGAAVAAGRWTEQRFGRQFGSPFMALLVGVVLIQGFSLAGDMLGIVGSFLTFFAFMFGLVGFFLKYVAWTVGLGAVVLSGMERSRGPSKPAVGQAPAAAEEPRAPLPPVPAGDGDPEAGAPDEPTESSSSEESDDDSRDS